MQKIPGDTQRVHLVSFNPEYSPINVEIKNIQELWMVNSKLSFGLEEPSDSTLLRQLQQSMEELKSQVKELHTH